MPNLDKLGELNKVMINSLICEDNWGGDYNCFYYLTVANKSKHFLGLQILFFSVLECRIGTKLPRKKRLEEQNIQILTKEKSTVNIEIENI